MGAGLSFDLIIQSDVVVASHVFCRSFVFICWFFVIMDHFDLRSDAGDI